MSIPLTQIRDIVVRPALQKMGLWSESAERLVIGTGLIETNYDYLSQVNGPALGPWQDEPVTINDTWDNFLSFRNDLKARITDLMVGSVDRVSQVAWNLQYAAALCRLKYLRAPEPLPAPDDIQGMAVMWKKVYNTNMGAGDSQVFYVRAINAGLATI